jgi:hypothetical protein
MRYWEWSKVSEAKEDQLAALKKLRAGVSDGCAVVVCGVASEMFWPASKDVRQQRLVPSVLPVQVLQAQEPVLYVPVLLCCDDLWVSCFGPLHLLPLLHLAAGCCCCCWLIEAGQPEIVFNTLCNTLTAAVSAVAFPAGCCWGRLIAAGQSEVVSNTLCNTLTAIVGAAASSCRLLLGAAHHGWAARECK